MKAAVIKFLISLFADEENRKRILLITGSILAGLLCMMILPFIILAELHQTEPSELLFEEDNFLSAVDTDKQNEMESACGTIADMLINKGLRNQILKAQLIYLSYAEEGEITDLNAYTDIFHLWDDSLLTDCLNSVYHLEIDKEEFQKTYLFVKNITIDPYLFTDAGTKNSSDLAAWCRNAYESNWLSETGRGEISPEKQWRTADNVGLILGYFNYLPEEKAFGTGYNNVAEFEAATSFYQRQNSNGFMNWCMTMGLWGLIVQMFPLVVNVLKRKKNERLVHIAFAIVYIGINMTEPLITSPLMIMLLALEYIIMVKPREERL